MHTARAKRGSALLSISIALSKFFIASGILFNSKKISPLLLKACQKVGLMLVVSLKIFKDFLKFFSIRYKFPSWKSPLILSGCKFNPFFKDF